MAYIGVMKQIVLLLSALTLAACANGPARLSADQCAADWAGVGYADGADGAPLSKLADYRAACSGSGAALTLADEADWRAGRKGGLAEFCEASEGSLTDNQIASRGQLCAVEVAQADYDDRAPVYADEDYGYDDYDDGYRYNGPRISPFLSVGFGSGGTRVGGGVGIGLGIFNLGFFF